MFRRVRWCLPVLVVALVSVAPALTIAQALPDDVSSFPWVIDGGAATTAVQIGSRVYLGGSFQGIARRSDVIGPVAAFDARSGQLALADPALAGAQVNAVVGDGAGGWFVGGLFVVDGQRRQLLRYDASGRRTPWALDVGGAFAEVYALKRVGTTLYLGGNFTSLAGQSRSLAAALDIPGEAVLPWNPSVTGTGVFAIEAQGAEVFLGGLFSAVAGTPRTDLASVHNITAALTPWAPTGSGFVQGLVATASLVYAGGGSGVAAIDRNSGATMFFVSAQGGENSVNDLAVVGDVLYVGGTFTSVQGQARHGAAAVDATNGTLQPWAPTASGSRVFALAASPDGIYLGGHLFAGVTRHAVRVHPVSGAVDAAWDPSPGSYVSAFAAEGSRVAVVGSFWTYRATPAFGLAAVDLATNRLVPMPTLGPRGASVNGLAARGNTLFVGGSFSTVGSTSRNGLAAIDTVTANVSAFAPSLTRTGGPSYIGALTVAGNALYIGGIFDAVDGVSRQSLAKLNADTGQIDPAFQAPPFPDIFNWGFSSLAVVANRVWGAGDFQTVGGSARARFAVFDAATGALDPFALQTNGDVTSLSSTGDAVFVSGRFSLVQGAPRGGVVKLDASSRSVSPWTASGFQGAGAAVANGPHVFAAGAGPLFSMGLLAFDAGLGTQLPWTPQLLQPPDALMDTGPGLMATTYIPGNGSPLYFARRQPANLPEAVADVGVLVQGTRVTVRWTPSPGGALPTSYQLLVGSRPGVTDTVVAMPRSAGAGVVADVAPGQYFIRVVPIGPGGAGPASREFAFTAGGSGCVVVPGPPTLMATGSPPVLTWTPPSGTTPTGYELRAGLAPGALDLVRLPLPASTTAYSTAGAPPGTYYVAVATVNACGVSVVSNAAVITVPPSGAPPAPTALAATVTGTTVSLSWTPPAGAVTGYVLEAGSAPGLANLVAGLALGPTPSFATPNVPPGTYYVRVRAANGTLVSAPSNESVVVVP